MRILVVDNDPLVLSSIRTILEFDGHDVVGANGGQAGIDTFSSALSRGERFAVVITDLNMPEVDGLKLARAVKSLASMTSVILVSGLGANPVPDAALPVDIDHILGKPLRMHELRAALAKCQSAV